MSSSDHPAAESQLSMVLNFCAAKAAAGAADGAEEPPRSGRAIRVDLEEHPTSCAEQVIRRETLYRGHGGKGELARPKPVFTATLLR